MYLNYRSKKIGKLFWKHELILVDQPNFSSNPFQILILQHTIPRASQSPLSSLSNFTLANWNPSSTKSWSCSWLFSYFVLRNSTTCHNYWMYQNLCHTKPTNLLSSYIYKYPLQKKLWEVKYTLSILHLYFRSLKYIQ